MVRKFSLAVARVLTISVGVTALIYADSASVRAADLGGDCCADLEERVAELEATTVRKGNRKVSVTLYGLVNQAVMFWDDGHESNAYVGDNGNANSRFGFKGKARISSDWSAGYTFEIQVTSGPSLNNVTQTNDNGGGLGVRHSYLYVQSKKLGKISLGRTSTATDDISYKAFQGGLTAYEQAVFHYEAGFRLRSTTGTLLTAVDVGHLCSSYNDNDGCFDSSARQNVIRYDSPSFAGFTLHAAWGEDDMGDIAVRYAGTFGDVRVSATAGYYNDTDFDNGGAGGVDSEGKEWWAGGGLMHVPTGLFVNAIYQSVEIDAAAGSGLNALPSADYWYLQGGIVQKWNPLGDTKVFGSYTSAEDGFIGAALAENDGNSTLNLQVGDEISSSKMERWAVGLSQNVDAAALQLYVLYRHTEIDLTTTLNTQVEDFDVFVAGGVIKF